MRLFLMVVWVMSSALAGPAFATSFQTFDQAYHQIGLGYDDDVLALAEQYQSQFDDWSATQQVQYLARQGHAYQGSRNTEQALVIQRQIVDLLTEHQVSDSAMMEYLLLDGHLHFDLTSPEQGCESYHQAYGLNAEAANSLKAMLLYSYSRCYSQYPDGPEPLALLLQATQMMKQDNSSSLMGYIQAEIAAYHYQQHHYLAAVDYFGKALERFQALEFAGETVGMLANLAVAHIALSDFEQASEYLSAAEQLTDQPIWLFHLNRYYAEMYMRQNMPKQAAKHALIAHEYSNEQAGSHHWQSNLHILIWATVVDSGLAAAETIIAENQLDMSQSGSSAKSKAIASYVRILLAIAGGEQQSAIGQLNELMTLNWQQMSMRAKKEDLLRLTTFELEISDLEVQLANRMASLEAAKRQSIELERQNFRLVTLLALVTTVILVIVLLLVWRSRKRIQGIAETDHLTGIDNRRAILSCYQQWQQSHTGFGVVLFDLDHFKQINDRLGHAAGDAALIHTVQVVLREIRQSDRIGRIGGEEFMMLLRESNVEQLGRVVERIRSAVECQPLDWQGEPVTITASFGYKQLAADNSETFGQLYPQLDEALYEAKNRGRNRAEQAV